jgi:rhodanese-related sulfurtransferase
MEVGDMVSIISTDELKSKIDSKSDFTLIDVREKEELEYGMIPTAINIPLDKLESELLMEGRFDKNKEIIFNCRTGARSAMATEIAIRLGFTNAKNYKGSIWEWSEIDSNVKRYGPSPF